MWKPAFIVFGSRGKFSLFLTSSFVQNKPFQEDGEKEKRLGVTYISAGMEQRIRFPGENLTLTLTPDPNHNLILTSS